jgi:thiol-disulfide isomerase/thioredoxin
MAHSKGNSMKRKLLSILALLLLGANLFSQTTVKKAQPLDLKVHVNGLNRGYLLLAYFFADQNRVLDTAWVDAKGNASFQADTAAPGGIYMVVLPSKMPFQLIIADEQKFSVDVADTNDMINSIKISGSKENSYFYEYQRYLGEQQKIVEPYQKALRSTKDKDSTKMLQQKITAIDSVVKIYKRDYYKKKHPETFMAKVLAAMDEPDPIPYDKCPRKANGQIDSSYNYWNFRNHYWDGMDFTDDRMIRTPVYHNKMKFFLDKLISPHPDSIIVALDWLIAKCRPSKELFKYTIYYCTYSYESSKIMGYDAIFVHLVNTYYKTGQTWWVADDQMKKITKRSDQVGYTLLGRPAVNLNLYDTTTTNVVPLYSLKAKYTIVIFWDPTCSHCKKEIPELKEYYDSLRKAGVDIEVYAIYSEMDYPSWKAYIKEHHLTWKNVCAKTEQELATAKYYYDVFSTPTLYLLNDKKEIFAKRLDVPGLKGFLNRRIEEDKKKAGSK